MSDLKKILELLPGVVDGRELSLVRDKTGYWYIGHPNRDGDFSVGLFANDRDPEGAAALAELDLISKCSGGGNWRRVVIQRQDFHRPVTTTQGKTP